MSAAESERYRALVERSADVIFMLDEHGIVTYANQTAEERVGTPLRRARRAGTRSTSSTPTTATRAVEALSARSRPVPARQEPFFARVRHADGHWLPVELVGNNLSDDEDVGGIVDHDARHRGPGPGGPAARRDRGELPPHRRDRRRRRVDLRRADRDDVRQPPDGRDARDDSRGHDRRVGLRLHGRRRRRADGHRAVGARAPRTRSRSATRSSSRTATATTSGPACSATPILGVDGEFEGVVSLRHRHHRAARGRGAAPVQRGAPHDAVRGLVGHHGDPRARRHLAREPGRHAHPRLPDRLGSRGRDPLARASRRHRARRAARSRRCWPARAASTSRSGSGCATSTATTSGSTARPRTRSTTRPCGA